MSKHFYRTLAYYPSKTEANKYYVVKINEEGALSCSCPGWIYRPNNGQRSCKHIILAREEFGDIICQVKEHGLSIVESPFVPADY